MSLVKKKSWLLMLVTVMVLGMLAACSGTSSTNEEGNQNEGDGEAKTGGTLTGAMDTAPTGLFNPIFYTEAYESNILSLTHEGLLSQNTELEFIPNLATEWEPNDDNTEYTFKLKDGVKWHDGEDFTADDVVFTYKTLSSPGYIEAGGVRTNYVERLAGYEDFSTGKTDDFQGVVKVDDHTVKFVFAEPNVLALADASFTIIPEHKFADVPVAEIPEHAASRDPNEVVGTGPFSFTEMVEGEQYVLTKHEDYWQGEPKLDSVVWRVVDQSVILGLLENGEIDFVADPNGFQAADFDTVAAMEHVEIVEQPDFGYQIMGMMHNHRAKGDTTISPDKWTKNEKLADPKVRQAIAYAIDRQAIIDGLLFGRGAIQNSPIATQFWAYDETNPNQYAFDADKANSLLDDAGYVDKDGDGFREDPQGNEWVLNLNYPTGNQIRERSAPIIEEFLEAVGINIDLRQPKEAAAYFEDLELNSQDWDLYLIGWSLGSSDPDPSGLWNSTAGYNYSRWNNPEADQLLKDAFTPPDAFDQEYRKKVYSDWQVKFSEDLPAVILYAQNSLWAHNKRFQGVEVLPYTFLSNAHNWYVTE
ncbi:peptide-binding protein [Rossellomorea aquimaris]|uniref:Peptide ABC transporter substrate-binding protein n=1 Tax=Rossellomorea aquimaris TaxID=189382 RepID=A0A5D4TJQ8_9BACI|nr:peptide-binding protein [Rossellomorea aquimaris]TYS75108.1 peptide ABC transporter substrate-binding protein [Rossellomorea aquimaris]